MRSLKKKFASAVAVTSVALLALTACGSDSGSDADAEAGSFPLNEGKLTICSDIPYEPFEFVKDGKNVGFDMDIAAEIAKDAELELNVIDASFDSIESGLFSTQCDIAISSISTHSARRRRVVASAQAASANAIRPISMAGPEMGHGPAISRIASICADAPITKPRRRPARP